MTFLVENGTTISISRLFTENDIQTRIQEYVDGMGLVTLNTVQDMIDTSLDVFIDSQLDPNSGIGTIYDAISQYVSDSTAGINGHSTIQTAIEDSIQSYADGIGVGANGQPFLEVMEAAQAAISNEIQSGGIIDTAIQAAVNP